jgi:hypothetical protein
MVNSPLKDRPPYTKVAEDIDAAVARHRPSKEEEIHEESPQEVLEGSPRAQCSNDVEKRTTPSEPQEEVTPLPLATDAEVDQPSRAGEGELRRSTVVSKNPTVKPESLSPTKAFQDPLSALK